jgi:hypothetical protein
MLGRLEFVRGLLHGANRCILKVGRVGALMTAIVGDRFQNLILYITYTCELWGVRL